MPSSRSKTRPTPSIHVEFEAIGTRWAIDMQVPASHVAALSKQVTARIAAFDKAYSRFRPDSVVAAMSRHSGTFTLPPDAAPLLVFYRQMYDVTDGAVTPLVGQLLSDAGYDAAYTLAPKATRPSPAWDDVLSYRTPVLQLHQPALLDFGAAGKGYLVDIISSLLEAHGVQAYSVDAGGDMWCSAAWHMRVGLEDPADASKAVGIAQISGNSLCGSAGNRRKWAGYHHIIDPVSMRSPGHIAAVWTVAGTAMLADGMATCLFFAAPDILQQHFPFEYVIMYTDRTVRSSARFPGELFIAKEG